jgi:hypothetical protein
MVLLIDLIAECLEERKSRKVGKRKKKKKSKPSKNKPNNPKLWSQAKSAARSKFDVYPSAYANAWASKWYKNKGGTWRKAKKGK